MSQFPSDEAFEHAAWLLMCDPRAIRAVAKVESGPLGAFIRENPNEPVILFEPHIFGRLTRHAYDQRRMPGFTRTDPRGVISRRTWVRAYGPASLQHEKLAYAAKISRDKALMSASWGLFQIMGFNYERCGYDSIQRFVNAMYRSVDDHLKAFTIFIRSNSELVDAIRDLDWPNFAYYYNGPGYEKNGYDQNIKHEYNALVNV